MVYCGHVVGLIHLTHFAGNAIRYQNNSIFTKKPPSFKNYCNTSSSVDPTHNNLAALQAMVSLEVVTDRLWLIHFLFLFLAMMMKAKAMGQGQITPTDFSDVASATHTDESLNQNKRQSSSCCACDVAKYELTFVGNWSRETHPNDFPPKHYGKISPQTDIRTYKSAKTVSPIDSLTALTPATLFGFS